MMKSLQIRLPNGSQMVQKFSAQEQLSAVRLFIDLNRKDGSNEPFNLMTAFPKKVFTEEEHQMTLQMLGKLNNVNTCFYGNCVRI